MRRASRSLVVAVLLTASAAGCGPPPQPDEPIAKLYADDGLALDLFGASVDIDGGIAIVGAPLARHEDEEGGFGGAAYLYNARTGTPFAKLTAGDEQQFGDGFVEPSQLLA